METSDKINLLSVLLFLLTGILHLISPLMYGTIFDTTGMIIFGIIYILLGILVQIKKENKIIAILSIICPLIGVILGIIVLLPYLDAFLLFVLLLDPIIIILRIYMYKQL